MPDITMCLSAECPQSETCYRFRVRPSEFWQAYAPFYGGEPCNYYFKITKHDLLVSYEQAKQTSLAIRHQSTEPAPVPSPVDCPPVAEDGK